MSKTALVILAEGAEEMEAIITADVLRRGGVEVTIAGLTGSGPVKCSRNVVIVPDKSLDEAVKNSQYDVVVLPGGLPGSNSLASSSSVGEVLSNQVKENRLIGAICAAPIALKSHGIHYGKKLTSHPSKKSEMEDGGKYEYLEDRVVEDGQLITSRGPGTAFEFALAIVTRLMGKEKSDSLVSPMLLKI